MSHPAPVNTVPTEAASGLTPPPVVMVVFDVGSLERTAEFYGRLLSFRVAAKERVGKPYETWTLTSDRYPGVALLTRRTFHRSVTGSSIGGVVQIGLREPELAAFVERAEGTVSWVYLPPGEAGAPERASVSRVSFLDPDGYIIELYK